MKNVAFYIPLLNIGGAERVIIDVLNYLSSQESAINYFLIVDEKNSILLHQLNTVISIIHLDSKQLFGIFQKAYLINQLIIKYKIDILFSHLTHANIHIFLTKYLFRINTKIIMVEHSILSKYIQSNQSLKHYVMQKLSRSAYSKSDLIVAVSESVKSDLVINFKINEQKVKRIYNPLDIHRLLNLHKENVDSEIVSKCNGKNVILSIGRLEPQKNHILLLKSIKLLTEERKDLVLLIVGDGSEYNTLSKYVIENSLSENVIFLGYQTNPYKFFQLSRFFILPSSFEGFGIVLVEAILFNQMIISTNIDASKEVLENGKYGLICGLDEISMVNKIREALHSSNSKKNFDDKVHLYSLENVCNEYYKIILSM